MKLAYLFLHSAFQPNGFVRLLLSFSLLFVDFWLKKSNDGEEKSENAGIISGYSHSRSAFNIFDSVMSECFKNIEPKSSLPVYKTVNSLPHSFLHLYFTNYLSDMKIRRV